MIPPIPTETYEEIFRLLPAPSLWQVGHLGGMFTDLRLKIYSARWKSIVAPYVDDEDVKWFVQCMLDSDAAIVGSAALWFFEPSTYWTPTNLNIVVPRVRANLVIDFFECRGWIVIQDIPSSTSPYSRTCESIFRIFPTTRHPRYHVTVAECTDTTIWPHVLASPSTLHMNVLTPSCFFSFYPELTSKYECLVRHMEGTDIEEVWEFVDTTHEKGYEVTLDNGNERVPCLSCPSRRRRTCGGDGMSFFVWNDEFFALLVDDYVEVVLSNFQLPHCNFLFQFSVSCFNPACGLNYASVFHHDTGMFTAIRNRNHDPLLPVPSAHAVAEDSGDERVDDVDIDLQFAVTDDQVSQLGRGILSLPASQCAAQLHFVRCFYYGPRCTAPHIVSVPAVSGTSVPFTPDDLHIGSWMIRHRVSNFGVFDNGQRRFTDDHTYPDGSTVSFTLYWEPSSDASSLNRPIRNEMETRASCVRPWNGAAVMVKHHGLRCLDVCTMDTDAARGVLIRFFEMVHRHNLMLSLPGRFGPMSVSDRTSPILIHTD